VAWPSSMAPVHWRVASWNLDWWARNRRRISPWELICQANADVFALQEVRGSEVRTIRSHHTGISIFSQEVYPRGTLRWMGCGLLLPKSAKVLGVGVVDELPKPQRGLWARVALPVGELTLVSWHAPNRVGDGLDVKMNAYRAMTDWLAAVDGPVVLGADLNTWTDPVDLLEVDTGDEHYEENAFVGARPRHGLVDAYRGVLERKGLMEILRATSPNGPLAVSHILRGGAKHRMDRILVSPEIAPIDGGYWHERSISAGSDHALHWVELSAPMTRHPASGCE
jgi:exonuclease III